MASAPATDRWARHRVAALAIAAGLDHHAITVTTTPEAFTTATGIDVGPADHGMASWADGRVIYVDPAKAANCGDLELVIAHEQSATCDGRAWATGPSSSSTCSNPRPRPLTPDPARPLIGTPARPGRRQVRRPTWVHVRSRASRPGLV